MSWEGKLPVAARPYFSMAKTALCDQDAGVLPWIYGAVVSGDQASLADLTEYLNLRVAQQLTRQVPFYVPRREQVCLEAPYRRMIGFGFVRDGKYPLTQPLDLLTQHTAIWGGTGTGKSNLTKLLMEQTLPFPIGVWVFDRKQEYRRFGARRSDGIVVDCQKGLRWNLFQVHGGMPPQQAITIAVTILSKTLGLMEGSQGFLYAALTELYSKRGVLDGSEDYPTVQEFLDFVESRSTKGEARTSQYAQILRNRLKALKFEAPDVWNCRRGFPIEKLAQLPIVFELHSLTEHTGRLLCTHLLTTLHHHRLRAGERDGTLRTWVIVDEAGWLTLPSHNVESMGWSPIADLLRMGRETGIGFLLASQGSYQDHAVLENVRTRLVFRLTNGADIERLRLSLSLSREQAEYITRMGTGECVVSIPQVHPFVLNVPEVRL